MLQVSAELKAKANSLCKEALQSLTITLAGSDTKHFWDLLTAFFGANHTSDNDNLWDFLDAAPEIPPPLPLTQTDTEDEKASVASVVTTILPPAAPTASAPSSKGWPCVSVLKDHLANLCSLDAAIRIYPSSAKKLNKVGIPEHLQVQRQHLTTGKGASVYICQHKLCKDLPYYTQSPPGLYSHIRRKHLGIALARPYCPKCHFWNTKGWPSHLDKHHPDILHFGLQLMDKAAMASQLLEQVQEDPDSLRNVTEKQERAFTPSRSNPLSLDLQPRMNPPLRVLTMTMNPLLVLVIALPILQMVVTLSLVRSLSLPQNQQQTQKSPSHSPFPLHRWRPCMRVLQVFQESLHWSHSTNTPWLGNSFFPLFWQFEIGHPVRPLWLSYLVLWLWPTSMIHLLLLQIAGSQVTMQLSATHTP